MAGDVFLGKMRQEAMSVYGWLPQGLYKSYVSSPRQEIYMHGAAGQKEVHCAGRNNEQAAGRVLCGMFTTRNVSPDGCCSFRR